MTSNLNQPADKSFKNACFDRQAMANDLTVFFTLPNFNSKFGWNNLCERFFVFFLFSSSIVMILGPLFQNDRFVWCIEYAHVYTHMPYISVGDSKWKQKNIYVTGYSHEITFAFLVLFFREWYLLGLYKRFSYLHQIQIFEDVKYVANFSVYRRWRHSIDCDCIEIFLFVNEPINNGEYSTSKNIVQR